MLNLDFVTLVNQVLSRINQPTVATLVGATGLTKSIADKFVNLVDQISTETDWWIHLEFRTFATVATIQDYAVAADFLKSAILLNTSKKFLYTQVFPRDFEARDLFGSAGLVNVFTIEKSNYRLLPIPQSVMTLREVYWRAPVSMTADTDKPDLPREIQFALIESVTGSVNEDLAQFEKADRNTRKFRETFAKVLETNSKRISAILGDELSFLQQDRPVQRVEGEGINIGEVFF